MEYERKITAYARENGIPGARKISKEWMIPSDIEEGRLSRTWKKSRFSRSKLAIRRKQTG